MRQLAFQPEIQAPENISPPGHENINSVTVRTTLNLHDAQWFESFRIKISQEITSRFKGVER